MNPRRDGLDWLMLLTLVALWGSSFLVTELALRALSPLTLVAARVAVAATVLLAAMRALRLPLPRDRRSWGFFGVLTLLGYCLPFFLVAWGQQSVDSSLAGILVGFMPLATLLLAHRFVPGERITPAKMAGFALGFVGLVVLIGPQALGHVHGTGTALLGELACLGGAVCYAANSVVTKRMPTTHALVAAACTASLSAAIMTVMALVLDAPWALRPDPAAWAACIWLGIGPTAIATLVFFRLIARAGPTFMSFVNYLSPLVAVGAGTLLLGEPLRLEALAALGLILSGIALATRGTRTRP
jgi:drug/metabolite transporter (DMT)-like permease